jgi:hypothetical protein
VAPPDDGDLLDELPLAEPLPLVLPELLPGLLGELEGELPPVAALPLFLVSELELDPAPALSRLQAAMPMASTKAVRAAVKAFIFMHLL